MLEKCNDNNNSSKEKNGSKEDKRNKSLHRKIRYSLEQNESLPKTILKRPFQTTTDKLQTSFVQIPERIIHRLSQIRPEISSTGAYCVGPGIPEILLGAYKFKNNPGPK